MMNETTTTTTTMATTTIPRAIEHDESSVDSFSSASSQETDANNTSSGLTEKTSSSFSLARAESNRVWRSKVLVMTVIGIAAAACGYGAYSFVRNDEEEDFKSQFEDFAIEITELSHHEADSILISVGNLGASITSYAFDKGIIHPNMTIPDFEIRGAMNNRISEAIQVTYAPLVYNTKRLEWEEYAINNQGWIDESLQAKYEFMGEQLVGEEGTNNNEMDVSATREPIPPKIYRYSEYSSGEPVVQEEEGITDSPYGNYAPVWQQSPAPLDTSIINYDLLSHPEFKRTFYGVLEARFPVLSGILPLEFLYGGAAVIDNVENPHSFIMQPVYQSFTNTELIGLVVAVLPWDNYFSQLLPHGTKGVDIVVTNTCGDVFTYKVEGSDAIYLGKGDLHDSKFDNMVYTANFSAVSKYDMYNEYKPCEYYMNIYPTRKLEDQYMTNKPIGLALVIAAVFIATAAVFIVYDYFVQERQRKVMAAAKRTNAIVSSLFPKNVRDRIMDDVDEQVKADLEAENKKNTFAVASSKAQLKDFLGSTTEKKDETSPFGSKPIADLFPSATVLFADIVGFTAWSSIREPCQVFTLLETLYQAFDEIAQRRRVFKVETIGDCYVAVCGLPDPRKDHAVVMARFARDCMAKMKHLTKKLETSLGPDTSGLSMRFGLHSGPVTAGVLRGDKGRFQLFGDTVNTASRIESSGERDKIHISQETADLLVEAGKGAWLTKREDQIQAKGKGIMQTFWLSVKNRGPSSVVSGSRCSSDDMSASIDYSCEVMSCTNTILMNKLTKVEKRVLDDKIQRLVDWNADVLSRCLIAVLARRAVLNKNDVTTSSPNGVMIKEANKMVVDEVAEIIQLPEYQACSKDEDPDSIVLDPIVKKELRNFVYTVATLYRENPFHNFEHASHVTMSVSKLMSRIVAPSDVLDELMEQRSGDVKSTLHDHTYGITSDPLTQFACVFAALIHDVDHSGVPNAQLVKEEADVAIFYDNRSPAEQNSIDLSWDLFMEPKYENLRNALCGDENEMQRFRQLVVNAVIATDIADKSLKDARNARWAAAFSKDRAEEPARVQTNRKATIVIEHLIQASDIAHTMQHWHIYRKWNERLFHEMTKAYREGRAEKDPAEFWYKGEIGFFDFYIIPLAKKLKECGVFGVSSDEYLNYAEKNRREWENRGEQVVAELMEKYKEEEKEGDEEVGLGAIQESDKGAHIRPSMFTHESFDDAADNAANGAMKVEIDTSLIKDLQK